MAITDGVRMAITDGIRMALKDGNFPSSDGFFGGQQDWVRMAMTTT